jgi:hypothetical protein
LLTSTVLNIQNQKVFRPQRSFLNLLSRLLVVFEWNGINILPRNPFGFTVLKKDSIDKGFISVIQLFYYIFAVSCPLLLSDYQYICHGSMGVSANLWACESIYADPMIDQCDLIQIPWLTYVTLSCEIPQLTYVTLFKSHDWPRTLFRPHDWRRWLHPDPMIDPGDPYPDPMIDPGDPI